MPTPEIPIKQQQHNELDQIASTFFTKFYEAKKQALRTGKSKDVEQVISLQQELFTRLNTLKDQIWPFETFPKKELYRQYESQRDIFERVGILQKLSNGERGFVGIDAKEYVFPSIDYIKQTMGMSENKELLKIKLPQGFKQLLIVPFGMKLGFVRKDSKGSQRSVYDGLIGIYAEQLRAHYTRGELYYTKAHPNDPFTSEDKIDTQHKFNESQPIWIEDIYHNADVDDILVYHVKEFSPNHKGKTKTKILEQEGGWQIIFIEDMPNIPKKDKGILIGGRSQIDTSGTSIQKYILPDYLTDEQIQKKQKGQIIVPSPHDYLNAFNNSPIYKGEHGMTPEENIIYAILYLAQNKQVIDDFQGQGSISYYLDSFLSGRVPYCYWGRGVLRLYVHGNDPDRRDDHCGVRPAVRLKLPHDKHV